MIKMPSAFQVSECVRRLVRRETETTLLAEPPTTVKLPCGGTFHRGDRAVVAMCADCRIDLDGHGTGHLAPWGQA